jgi:hypothetical protein
MWSEQVLFLFVDHKTLMKALINKLKIKKKETVDFIIRGEPPTLVSQSYGSIILCFDTSDTIYICAPGCFFRVPSLAAGLVTLVQLFFVLDIHYPKHASRLFEFVAHVCGVKSSNLSNSQKILL